MKPFNVAIDGPSGAGKSSVADAAAEKYRLTHLDTGAMYRAIAWMLNSWNVPAAPSRELEDALNRIDLVMKDGSVIANGKDLSRTIRQPEVSELASMYSALPAVRKRLVALQQKIAEDGGYILDGRDICDVVLPDAPVKIYLDAAPKARAKRRQLQNEEKGIESSYQDVLKAIEERDERDRSRAEAPLRISAAATVIDSSDLTFDQTVQAVCALIDQALAAQENE